MMASSGRPVDFGWGVWTLIGSLVLGAKWGFFFLWILRVELWFFIGFLEVEQEIFIDGCNRNHIPVFGYGEVIICHPREGYLLVLVNLIFF